MVRTKNPSFSGSPGDNNETGGSRKRKAMAAEKGKQKAAPSKDSDNPNPFNFEGESKKRYESLPRRAIVPTKYMHEPFLHSCGMLDDVDWMIGRCHMTNIARLGEPTYRGDHP